MSHHAGSNAGQEPLKIEEGRLLIEKSITHRQSKICNNSGRSVFGTAKVREKDYVLRNEVLKRASQCLTPTGFPTLSALRRSLI
jgi:hypothetical protein